MGNVIPCGGSRTSSSASTSGGGGARPGHEATAGGRIWASSSHLPDFSNRGKATESADNEQAAMINNASKATTATYGCRVSSFVGLRTAPHHPEHQLRMRRPQKLKCMLGFAKLSHAYTAIRWACDRLGVEVTPPPTYLSSEALLSSWTSANREGHPPHLIILDCRANKQLDVETVARSVRHGVHGDHVVLIGILKKSVMEREELVVETYLQAGFNRLLLDSGSRGYWLNELAMIIHTDVEASLRLQCADLLLTALDNCQDVVQVTDSQDRVIYENTGTEKVLGYSSSDWLEKCIWDYQNTVSLTESVLPENDSTASIKGSDLVRQKLDHGKVWEGQLSCRRKAGGSVILDTKIIPVSFTTKRLPENLVYVRRPPHPTPIEETTQTTSATVVATSSGPASSFSGLLSGHHHGGRRASSKTATFKDVPNVVAHEGFATSMVRRTSTSKIFHTMSIEAPITKVIHILMSARESSPLYIAQALDKVLDILQVNSSIDLFTPELDRERHKRSADPVTTDLLGALLANSTRDALHQRRSSNDGATSRSASISATGGSLLHHRSSLAGEHSKPPLPSILSGGKETKIKELLIDCHQWTFDIFSLERLTDSRCLSNLGMAILVRFELHKTLGCSEDILQNWLTLIEANYKRTNTYHNSTHAADVLHAAAYFLEQEPIKEMCDGVDEAICLIAAVIHDVDHPGKNSAFLCNSGSELANLYNDITVLENHHSAFGFKLTMSDERVNIFQNLDRDSFKLMRQGIIDLVLATDMSKHFIHLNKFLSVFANTISDEEEKPEETLQQQPLSTKDIPNSPENVAILKRMLIKCADVSNPARPLEICKIWAYRIAEEYFSQTDEEKRLGLPVVMPQFDRSTCSIPKSQLGFYDYFIHDMFDVWNGFTELPLLSEQIRSNYLYWKAAVASEDLDRRKSNSDSEAATKE